MIKPKSVDAYIEAQAQWQVELLLLRQIMLDQGLEETIKWSLPVYCHNNRNIASLGSFKKDLAIWFFQGSTLTDPLNVLVNAQENKTKSMRSWRFTSLSDINELDIIQYLQEAIENEISGNVIKPIKKVSKPIIIPSELQYVFDENHSLLNTFKELRISSQREFCDYIADAKRIETKYKRIEKIIPLIISGTSLNDKYRT